MDDEPDHAMAMRARIAAGRPLERIRYLSANGLEVYVDGVRGGFGDGRQIVHTIRGPITLNLEQIRTIQTIGRSTPAQRRASRTYDERKAAEGYRSFHVRLPPEVADRLDRYMVTTRLSRNKALAKLIRDHA